MKGLQLVPSSSLREFFASAAADSALHQDLRELASSCAKDSIVSYSCIREIWLKLDTTRRVPLHKILSDATFHLESPKPRVKCNELKARLQKLLESAERKAYDELVSDVARHDLAPEYFLSYKDQLGFGLHVALTMFTGFMVGYTVFRALFHDNFVLHAAGGATGLIIGMLVETVLFIVRASMHDEHQSKGSDVRKVLKPLPHTKFRRQLNPLCNEKED